MCKKDNGKVHQHPSMVLLPAIVKKWMSGIKSLYVKTIVDHYLLEDHQRRASITQGGG